MLMEEASTPGSSQQHSEPIQYAKSTWKAFAALATEHQHALRHVLDNKPDVEESGEVHQRHETVSGLTDSTQTVRSPEALTQTHLSYTLQRAADAAPLDEAVRIEMDCVKAKVTGRNPDRDVVVRLEIMRGTASRATAMAIVAAIVVGAIILVAELIKKLQLGSSLYFFRNTTLYAWNVAVAALCLAILTPFLANLMWHLYHTTKLKKAWFSRVKISATLLAVEAVVQWINLVFYLAPNVYLLCNPCYVLSPVTWASGFVQWTCWNTIFMLFLAHSYGCQQLFWTGKNGGPRVTDHSSDVRYYGEVVVDRGFYQLWPCLIPWLLFEAAVGYAWLHHIAGGLDESALLCEAGQQSMPCNTDKGTHIGISVTESLSIAYFVITCALLWRKLRYLKKLPYSGVKRGIVYFTIQLWLRLGVMAYFVLCMVLLWLIRFGTCAANEFVDTGIMPMHVVMTVNAVVFCYVATPVSPSEHAAACKVWLQEVAWTEDDKIIKLAARSAMIPNDVKMEKQPLFCYETMLNLLYWSCLVYDHDRGKQSMKGSPVQPMTDPEVLQSPTSGARTILTLETAMSLYGLTESESFWEVKQDTHCLVSWGGTRVLVAFRGTASIKNALADLQAWRVNHPPVRGKRCMGTRPLVHVGFLKSWLAGGLNHKVTSAVHKAVQHCRKRLQPSQKITIFVTGHSLGGAMATLAAYDIQTSLHTTGSIQVICYTFAAPRTGNHAFARDYNAVVPDTWSVINDQDVVTREGKLLYLYKRPGQRVIVDAKGRLIVRPTHIEASVQRDTAGQSMKQHLLSSYFHAVLSVALAQFGSSGFPCGMPGIIRLAESSPYVQDVLESQMGMQLEDMKRYSQLDPSQRVESVLPGSHPPVKGFYLIKPSPVIASSKSLNRSPSLLTRLRNPKRSSSTHSLVLSPSISEFDALSGNLEGEALESSLHSHVSSDPAQKDASEVVSGNLEAEVLKSSLQSREKADPAQEGASEAVVDVDEIPLAH